MRLVRAVLFVALTGSWALADEAKPADPQPEVAKGKVPYRVVEMLPETGQVLLFDRIHGTHVVAEVGQYLEGYLVDEIAGDEVTLVADNGAHIILTAPLPPRRPIARKAPAAEREAAPSSATTGPAPVDPYADPEPPKVAGEGGVRVASAATATPSPPSRTVSAATGAPVDADPYEDPGAFAPDGDVGAGFRAAPEAPSTTSPTMTSPAKPSPADAKSTEDAFALAAAATGSLSSTPASTPPASAPPSTDIAPPPPPLPDSLDLPADTPTTTSPSAGALPTTATIARAELDAALADFGKLAASFRATFTPEGLRFDAVHEGSLLGKVGLRKGDVITHVDGRPLRSLDDAANLYARAGSVRATTVQVVRDGKPVTLRVAIQ